MIRKFILVVSCLFCAAFDDIDALLVPFREDINQAAVADGRIWIVHGDGMLRAYDLDGRRDVSVPEARCFSLTTTEHEVWCANWRELPDSNTPTTWLLSRVAGGPAFEAPPITLPAGDQLTELLMRSAEPSIIGKRSVSRLLDGRWVTQPLAQDLFGGRNRAHALTGDGRTLYLGFNNGEFGGGIDRVDLQTGQVTPVNLCDGAPNQPCDAITGVVADGDCILASSGLEHGGQTGRVVRVCDDVVQRSMEIPTDSSSSFRQTVPIYGLATTESGVWAISRERVYRVENDGLVADRPMALQQTGALRADRSIPGYLILAGPPERVTSVTLPGFEEPMEVVIGEWPPIVVAVPAGP